MASTGLTALITGAGSGIGRGVAVALDQIGVRVALIGRDLKKLEETRGLLGQAGGEALTILDPADWDKMIATNLTGAFNLAFFVLPYMRERQSGLVIQIDSISGKRVSLLGGVGYSASKFGQAALGIGIGREEGAKGIRSTVIYPGEVNTPILDSRPVAVPADRRAAILQPEDVGNAVRFLVELHPRANIPELVIKPTVDDWF